MKEIISFYMLFLFSFINSQIKMEIKSLNNNSINQNYIEVKIINNSNFYYAIPIDTTDLKPDFFEGKCDYNYENDFIFMEKNDMLLRISFTNNDTNKLEEEIYNFPNPQDLSHSEIIKNEYFKKKDSAINKFNSKINNWIKLNNIKKGGSFAKINYLLYSNLLLLKPKEEVVYNINIDYSKLYSSRIHETDSYYYYYNLKKDVEYNFTLNYCIDKNIYKYLTKKQVKKIKGYKLFSGNLNSNILKWSK